jgi:hypothetical protein
MAVWYSLWSFVIFFPNVVCLGQEKSGNPVSNHQIPQNLWRLARVVSVSKVGPEDRGLESPPVLKVLGINAVICFCLLINTYCFLRICQEKMIKMFLYSH